MSSKSEEPEPKRSVNIGMWVLIIGLVLAGIGMLITILMSNYNVTNRIVNNINKNLLNRL